MGWLKNQTGLSFGAHTGTWVQDTPYANKSDPRAVGEWVYVDAPKHPGQKKLVSLDEELSGIGLTELTNL
eukprot:COSAG04_NODE_2364_length_4263_cov_4.814601_5_plen_70_part_00